MRIRGQMRILSRKSHESRRDQVRDQSPDPTTPKQAEQITPETPVAAPSPAPAAPTEVKTTAPVVPVEAELAELDEEADAE